MSEKKIKGIIEAVSLKEKGYGIKINHDWFNGWGHCPYEKGQEVEIEWHQSGDFKKIGPEPKSKPSGNINSLIEVLAQNKVNFFITEKVDHPNGKKYNMKDYGASHSVNMSELTLEKGVEIYDLLQQIIDKKKEKDRL